MVALTADARTASKGTKEKRVIVSSIIDDPNLICVKVEAGDLGHYFFPTNTLT